MRFSPRFLLISLGFFLDHFPAPFVPRRMRPDPGQRCAVAPCRRQGNPGARSPGRHLGGEKAIGKSHNGDTW